MWRERIGALFGDARFSAPAKDDEIRRIERDLTLALPAELKALLQETNGVAANSGSPLVWPAGELVEQNRLFRTNPEFADLYLPFDSLLFFGADGNGDQFAYRILRDRVPETSGIYKWDHESDNRTWFASDLNDYFRRCRADAQSAR